MRVLLVGSAKKTSGFDRIARLPNLGLSSIAANIDRTNCDIKILELNVAGKNPHQYYSRFLKKYRPDVIGLSCMSYHYAETIELAKLTKEINQNSIIVLGGYHPTSDYDVILESDDMQFIDYVIRCEGEITFNELMQSLINGKNLSNVPNLSYQHNGSVIHNQPGQLVNLDYLKSPDRNARILKKGFYLFGYPADVVETSRGCVFDCDFCSIKNMYGKSFRTYKIERVIDDIRDARSHGAKALMVADDNITIAGKRYMELCDAIIDAKLNRLKYFVQASVQGLKKTPGLAEKMVKAGAKWIFLGIENESKEAMDFLVKSNQFKKSDAFDVIGELKEQGAMVLGGIIVGNPTDTREKIWANYDYLKQLRVDFPLFMTLTPYPKTGIREKLLKEGLITNLYNYSKYDCFQTNIKTRHLTSSEVSNLRRSIEFRYPLETGAMWRLIRMYPLFFAKIIVKSLFKEPKILWGFAKGIFNTRNS